MKKATAQPLGNITTEVTLPVFPLEHRCKVCRIYHENPAVFDELCGRLLMAQPRDEILAWLADQGFAIGAKNLSRHYQQHVRPHIQDVLKFERRLRAEMKVLDGVAEGDIASALSRQLASDGLLAIRKLNLASLLQRISKPEEAIAALREFTRLCKALADISRAAAETELKRKLIALRAIELALKEGRADEIARQWIGHQLEGQPQKRDQILGILGLAPMKQVKALPAPARDAAKHGTQEANSRSRSARRSNPARRRKAR